MKLRQRMSIPMRTPALALGMVLLPVATVLGTTPHKNPLQHVNPATLPRLDYLSQVVVAKNARHVARIAGQSAMNVKMNIEGKTIAAQLPVALNNFDLALKAAGANRKDVLHMNVFYVDPEGASAKRITRAIRDYFAPHPPPAVTFVGVPSLVSPAMLVEIDGMALVEERG